LENLYFHCNGLYNCIHVAKRPPGLVYGNLNEKINKTLLGKYGISSIKKPSRDLRTAGFYNRNTLHKKIIHSN